jgi:hypothetical protein
MEKTIMSHEKKGEPIIVTGSEQTENGFKAVYSPEDTHAKPEGAAAERPLQFGEKPVEISLQAGEIPSAVPHFGVSEKNWGAAVKTNPNKDAPQKFLR